MCGDGWVWGVGYACCFFGDVGVFRRKLFDRDTFYQMIFCWRVLLVFGDNYVTRHATA